MRPTTRTGSTPLNPGRSVRDRDANLTGAIRCRAYGLYSALLASPHEFDFEEQFHGTDDILVTQPYGIDLNAIIGSYLECTRAQRRLEYSELFEVGDKAPPVPVREQQQFGSLADIREDLLRFYQFFEYTLHQRNAWAPDHISVLLEFCALLCYFESTVSGERLSYQLAQLDFVSRHLVSWTPVFAQRVDSVSPKSIYARVAGSLSEFLTSDYRWQASTVIATNRKSDRG